MSGNIPPGSPRLEDHPFLRGLSPGLLEVVRAAARSERFELGRLLVHEGTPAEEFYLLVAGKVALELGGPGRPHLTLQTLGPGELLGWSWLVPPGRWRFDARALRETIAWTVAAPPIREALAARPTDGMAFLSRLLPVLASRLEHARLQLGDLYAP